MCLPLVIFGLLIVMMLPLLEIIIIRKFADNMGDINLDECNSIMDVAKAG